MSEPWRTEGLSVRSRVLKGRQEAREVADWFKTNLKGGLLSPDGRVDSGVEFGNYMDAMAKFLVEEFELDLVMGESDDAALFALVWGC